MTRQESLRHEFVEFIPDQLEDGVFYVSMTYATTAHTCACGCGNEVFAPLSPTDWKLIFDGETVSLNPSIGNWSFPCQSHYWVDEGRIRWAPRWSREKIDRGRELDRLAKKRNTAGAVETEPDTGEAPPATVSLGWLKRLLRRDGVVGR